MSGCMLCPRRCGADRTIMPGACGAGAAVRVSRVSRHMWEEPCISGTRGSGTVFFSGCSLRCVFCQNAPLSRECRGEDVSTGRLAELFLEIQASGAHNVNLVTPTHFTDGICEALSTVRDRLLIPVVWNSSGYELPGTLAMTRGLVDIYMPDIKYSDPHLAEEFSSAPDYPEYALKSLSFMYGMLGPAVIGPDGLMKRGILVRHLVLPGCRHDSIDALRGIAAAVPPGDVILSLMAQYTPSFYGGGDGRLRRRVTTFEYESVREEALRLGFGGYMQSPCSATEGFTPAFTDTLTVDLGEPPERQD